MNLRKNLVCAAALAAAAVAPATGQELLSNGSFEQSGFGAEAVLDWGSFGNFTVDDNTEPETEVVPFDGDRSVKLFGSFPGAGGQSDNGLNQNIPVTGGQFYRVSIRALNPSFDPLTPTGGDPFTGHLALLIADFFEVVDPVFGTDFAISSAQADLIAIDPDNPTMPGSGFTQLDTWTEVSFVVAAPANAASMTVTPLLIQFSDAPGSVFIDVASVTQVDGGAVPEIVAFVPPYTAPQSVFRGVPSSVSVEVSDANDDLVTVELYANDVLVSSVSSPSAGVIDLPLDGAATEALSDGLNQVRVEITDGTENSVSRSGVINAVTLDDADGDGTPGTMFDLLAILGVYDAETCGN